MSLILTLTNDKLYTVEEDLKYTLNFFCVTLETAECRARFHTLIHGTEYLPGFSVLSVPRFFMLFDTFSKK